MTSTFTSLFPYDLHYFTKREEESKGNGSNKKDVSVVGCFNNSIQENDMISYIYLIKFAI